jgi:hypothetical protein
MMRGTTTDYAQHQQCSHGGHATIGAMKKWVLVMVLSGCFVASPVVRFGSGKSASEAQHDEAAKLTPPALVVDGEWSGEIRTEKVSVWADDDYRAQNVHWQRTFDEELDYANHVLGSIVGLKLVPEYHDWPHHEPGHTLDEDLTELAQADPGDGVLTVIGLTSSMGLVSATFDQIGLATTPGNHMMLRGYADVEERAMFERYFKKLSGEERESMYTARRRHKTTALLLHELAHNLGAPHSVDADTIMYPIYSDRSAAFDADTKELMLARLGHKPAAIAQATPAAMQHPVLAISVDASGQLILGGRTVDDDTLDGLLQLSFKDDPETEVIVKAAKGAPHAAVVKVLEHAKAAGLTKMAIGAQ